MLAVFRRMRSIPLSDGLEATVEDGDYEGLRQFDWRPVRTKNAIYAFRYCKETQKTVYMHRDIMGPRPSEKVDHINGDGLDNRRENLRCCSHRENIRNQPKHNRKRPCSSSFKGVCWDKSRQKWISYITVDYKRKMLGRFDDERIAARTYNAAARRLFGEFASLNAV